VGRILSGKSFQENSQDALFSKAVGARARSGVYPDERNGQIFNSESNVQQTKICEGED
jgi:hypothetical protein